MTKKLLPTDKVNVCCIESIYGGTFIGLNDRRISGGKPAPYGTVYHDDNVTYEDLADAFSEDELKLMLKIKQGKVK